MRRFNLFLALLLVVGAGLFVALVMVPQLRQSRHFDANVLANESDLVGTWSIDVDATRDSWRTSSVFSKRFANLPPKTVEALKSTMLTGLAGAVPAQITTDKMIAIENGVLQEMSYTITATSGNVFTANCITHEGNAVQMNFTVTEDRLEIINTPTPASSDLPIIFKRVR